jgi:hypothetical protein
VIFGLEWFYGSEMGIVFVMKIVRYVDEILDFVDELELIFGHSFEC